MSTERAVQDVVESAIHQGWSIEKFLVHCRDAWMYALSENERGAESRWTKYLKPTGR